MSVIRQLVLAASRERFSRRNHEAAMEAKLSVGSARGGMQAQAGYERALHQVPEDLFSKPLMLPDCARLSSLGIDLQSFWLDLSLASRSHASLLELDRLKLSQPAVIS